MYKNITHSQPQKPEEISLIPNIHSHANAADSTSYIQFVPASISIDLGPIAPVEA